MRQSEIRGWTDRRLHQVAIGLRQALWEREDEWNERQLWLWNQVTDELERRAGAVTWDLRCACEFCHVPFPEADEVSY